MISLGPVPGMRHPQGKNFLLVSCFPAAAHPCRASVCAQAPLGRGWLHPFSTHHAALVDSSKSLWHLLAESCSAWWFRWTSNHRCCTLCSALLQHGCQGGRTDWDTSPGSVLPFAALGDAGGEGREWCNAVREHRQGHSQAGVVMEWESP